MFTMAQINAFKEKAEAQTNAIKEQMAAGVPREEAVKNVMSGKTDTKKPLVIAPKPNQKPNNPALKPLNLGTRDQKLQILDEGIRKDTGAEEPQSKTITASASASNGAIVIVIIAVIAIVAGFIYWKTKKSK
jgi:cobalamin biosynthesis Mg chelatase CobN